MNKLIALILLAGLASGCAQQGVAQNPFDLDKDGSISTKTMNPSKMGVRLPDGTVVATDGLGQNSFNHMTIGYDVQSGDPIYTLDSANSNGPSNEFQLPVGNKHVLQGRTASGQKFKIAKYSVTPDGGVTVQGFQWDIDPAAALAGYAQLINAMSPTWDRMTEAQKVAYLAQLQTAAKLGDAAATGLVNAFKIYMGVP